jgi:ribosomal protein S18 acetylase RimI-like enzyme
MIKLFTYRGQNRIKNFFLNYFPDNLGLIENKTIILIIENNNEIIAGISLLLNDHLVDYLQNSKNDIDLSYYTIRASKGLYLYNLAVKKKYRKKNFAKKLIESALIIGKELKCFYIHTHATNNISYHLFSKYLFFKENQFTNKYKKEIYLMSLWLN